MRRIGFVVAEDELEAVLDTFMERLPRGVRTAPAGEGRVRVTALGPRLPERARLEALAGRSLDGWTEEEAPADWQQRREDTGVLVGGRVLLRAPEDPAPPEGVIDVAIAWDGTGFGSGSHPTTQMCAELLLGLAAVDSDVAGAGAAGAAGAARGGLADVGCGLGTLAILAAKLDFAPVVAVDREAGAVERARANAERNGVDVAFAVVDVESGPVPYEPTLTVNAPPAVHARVAESLPAGVRAVVVSGITTAERDEVAAVYAQVGLAVTEERVDPDALWSALVLAP